MSRYTVEYVESLRFERVNDDGTKTVFSVEEPKSIGLTSPRSILTGKYGVQIGGVNHCWDEVFSSKTKIILVEGYFIFSTQKMRDLFDMRFYTKVDDDIRFTRLILRENEIMKNDPKAIQAFCLVYQKYMKPSFESNIEVEEKYANLVLPNYEINDKEEIEIADDIMEFLLVGLQTLIHDTKKIHA